MRGCPLLTGLSNESCIKTQAVVLRVQKIVIRSSRVNCLRMANNGKHSVVPVSNESLDCWTCAFFNV